MTIVIKKVDGSVAVMRLIGDGSEADCLAQWRVANPGQYLSHASVDEAELPQDRTERDQWSLVDGAVVVDPALAPVPQSVSRRQGRAALRMTGKLELVQPAIDAIADPLQRDLVQIDWDDATSFDRGWPTLIQLADAIGLDSAGLDEMFRLAATL